MVVRFIDSTRFIEQQFSNHILWAMGSSPSHDWNKQMHAHILTRCNSLIIIMIRITDGPVYINDGS